MGDFLLLLWDAIGASAFMMWFLIGAILGGGGLASVALRFIYWRKSR